MNDFKLFGGFDDGQTDGQTDERTDIGGCRVAFATENKSKSFKCRNTQSPCVIVKLNRSHCKKCRYEKCLSIGMLPHLVDSWKRNKDDETTSSSEMNSPYTDVAIVRYEPFNETLIKDTLSDQFQAVYTNSSISKDLYSLDSYMYQQILEKKEDVIVVPENMLKIVKTFFEFRIRNLYQKIFPAFSSEKITLLADNVAYTIIALQNKGCLEQFKSSYMLYNSSSWDFYQKLHPQITRIKTINLMEMDCFRSPYANQFEDEELLNTSFSQLKNLMNGDAEQAGLFCLLALFSPVSLTLSKEETHQLKNFQKKSSFLLYEYIMSKENSDNQSTLEKMSSLVNLLSYLNKIGYVLCNELIQHGIDSITNLDMINVDIL